MSQDLLLKNLAKFIALDAADKPVYPGSKKPEDASDTPLVPVSEKPEKRSRPPIRVGAGFIDSASIDIPLPPKKKLQPKKQPANTVDVSMRENLQGILNEKGFCHGLSVCHAIMEKSGYLAWWEAALKVVADWDGDENKLDEEINLPDARETTTRRAIFFRVLNYVSAAQVNSDRVFTPFVVGGFEEQSQGNVFKSKFLPLSVYLGIDMNGKNEQFIIGNYNVKILNKIISDDLLRDNIVIVEKLGHAIRIGFLEDPDTRKRSYILYDPNLKHDGLDDHSTIYKSFDTQEDMLEFMNKRLETNSIALHIVPTKNIAQLKNKLETDEKVAPVNPISLKPKFKSTHLTSDVLHLMIKYTPDDLKELLQKIAQKPVSKLNDAFTCSINRVNIYLLLNLFPNEICGMLKTNVSFKHAFYSTVTSDKMEMKLIDLFLINVISKDQLQLIVNHGNYEFNANVELALKANVERLQKLSTTKTKEFVEVLADVDLSELLTVLNKMTASGKSNWQLLHEKSPALRKEILILITDKIKHVPDDEVQVRMVYLIAVQLSQKDEGPFKEMRAERHSFRSSKYGNTNSWQQLMQACQERLSKVDPQNYDFNYGVYNSIISTNTSRFGGLFSKNTVSNKKSATITKHVLEEDQGPKANNIKS